MARIIAGRAKGMRIDAPKGDGTRPTTDRVKEALFSALVSWFGTVDHASEDQLDDVAVLDLFSGSGALALESASRGASRVVAVDHRTGSTIRNNAASTRLAVTVLPAKAEVALTQLSGVGEPFDLVFLDPPYDMAPESVDRLLAALVDSGVLAPRSLVVVERPRRGTAPQWPHGIPETWHRRYGETVLYFGALPDDDADAPTEETA